MLNSRGPSIEPCGTLIVIFSHSVKFSFTLCFLSIKQLFMYLKASVSNPYALNLAIPNSWFNMSKTFEKFMKIAQIYYP